MCAALPSVPGITSFIIPHIIAGLVACNPAPGANVVSPLRRFSRRRLPTDVVPGSHP